jgi:hypothetical protein
MNKLIFLKETEVIVNSTKLKTELENSKLLLMVDFKKELVDSEKKHKKEIVNEVLVTLSGMKIEIEELKKQLIKEVDTFKKENYSLNKKFEDNDKKYKGETVNLQNQINTLSNKLENNKTGFNSSTTKLEKKLKELENTLTCEMDFDNFSFGDSSDKPLYNIRGNRISFTAGNEWTSLFSNKKIEKVFCFFYFCYLLIIIREYIIGFIFKYLLLKIIIANLFIQIQL